ncbi:hypothetical protein OGAPHI_002101 [Ogataea philodendri]|uniref:Uncharacterized protein n=1 Tax=Ogataea philodendri TaxID=1378263 RepID=A0A9P8PAK9_9ASCO|nr:uncharacterized protein OGAPHI_002101 [Ogataea philodendri]KAH3668347.1 hypothetical protein OGAPHI_002101 [Ogataea philodendri]
MDKAVSTQLENVPNLHETQVRKNDHLKEKLSEILDKCNETPTNWVFWAENESIQKLLTVVEIVKRKHPNHSQFNQLLYKQYQKQLSEQEQALEIQKPSKMPILYIYLHIVPEPVQSSNQLDQLDHLGSLKSSLIAAGWSLGRRSRRRCFNTEFVNTQITWESTVASLIVPFFDPRGWTQRLESRPKHLTWSKVFSLQSNTLVVVQVRLVAMLGLVLLRESGVEAWGLELVL